MSKRVLFSDHSVFDVMAAQKLRVREELQRLPLPRLDDPELPENLAREYGLNVPVLNEDGRYANQKETQVDVSRDPNRFVSDRSRPLYMSGTEVRIFVPFTGDPGVFKVRPSSFDTNPPIAEVLTNELCLTYSFVDAPTSLTSEYERTIGQVKKYLQWLRPSAQQLNSELVQLVQATAAHRKTQAGAHKQVLDSLGIPIRGDVPRIAASAFDVPRRPVAAQRNKVRKVGRAGWDVFISHASEDKDEIARPLAKALQAKGFSVWYDEFSLKVGDSLRQSIDHGLAFSRFGIIIFSQHFFAKHWPQQELNGLASREVDGKKVILPIWHKIDSDAVRQYSPMLADRLAVLTDAGLENVVQKIMEAMA